jgi:hypothetical protein
MSTRSKKVVNKGKINEVLKQKGKEMLGEAFEGMGGVVTMKPIHNMDGAFTKGSVKPVTEGPSYEYANYMKKIEKAENLQAKEVNNLVKLLQKKGLKKEATSLASAYMNSVKDFDEYLKDLYSSIV